MVNTYKNIAVIVVAAGSGNRFGNAIAKQFCLFNGRPLLMHCIDVFRQAIPSALIVVALAPDMMPVWDELCAEYNFATPQYVAGGASRAHSVRNVLNALPADTDIVLVHDAARPLIDKELILRVIDGAVDRQAAVPAIPVTDSLRRADSGKAVDRTPFRAVQTPQGFQYNLLVNAYKTDNLDKFTDDASLVEAYGVPVTMVEGSPDNIKITWPRDIAIATAIFKDKEGDK